MKSLLQRELDCCKRKKRRIQANGRNLDRKNGIACPFLIFNRKRATQLLTVKGNENSFVPPGDQSQPNKLGQPNYKVLIRSVSCISSRRRVGISLGCLRTGEHGFGTPILRTRIVEPMELRVKMAMERLNLTENGATAYIQKVDQERQKWTRYLYGVTGRILCYMILLPISNSSVLMKRARSLPT